MNDNALSYVISAFVALTILLANGSIVTFIWLEKGDTPAAPSGTPITGPITGARSTKGTSLLMGPVSLLVPGSSKKQGAAPTKKGGGGTSGGKK